MILKSIERLAEALDHNGIPYCHWKGNYSLARVLSGEKDFELFVDRKSFDQALSTLASLGYKRAVVKREEPTPGISHYYGLDRESGKLVHVHLYHSLLTGENLINSHALPLEAMLLEHVGMIGSVKVPSKAAELIVHTLRMYIQYGSLMDWIELSEKAADNDAALRWLQDGTDMSVVLDLLKEYCPLIDELLFIHCLNALHAPSSLPRRVLLARQARQRLSVYSRYSGFQRILAYARILWGKGRRLLDRNETSKMLDSGGAVIAFVGSEATGKSTLVTECEDWLGSVFRVRTVHAGKPPSSWLTVPANMVVPLVRTLFPRWRTSRLEGHVASTNPAAPPLILAELPALIYALGAVILAWDRRQLLVKCWRSARNGEIVICDRYPSETIGMMDSPRLQEDLPPRGIIRFVYRWLARIEHRLYDQIPPPDIVFRLYVSVETAKRRNRERIKVDKETDAYVESRHRQFRSWCRSGTRYSYDIDTEQPLAESIRNVKQLIWESL